MSNNNLLDHKIDFSNMSLKGKYIETNLGNKGVVVYEYITYPEPSEWALDNGYVMDEFSMHCNGEHIILIKEE